MTTQTVSSAVATRDNSPISLLEQYKDDFALVLPSQVKPATFVRLAIGALRRDPKLNEAAANNPAAFLGAVLDAARLGHEPGTDAYWLIPRRRKIKENGREFYRTEVQGIEGYTGIVERIYRAGAVSSVIVEVVRQNDTFTYSPGKDDRPVHVVDWWGDRGDLVGVYAYAVMKDGATSKVVVLNRQHVESLKARSDSAKGPRAEYSPWNTDEEAMWLKSAARQLRKWIPTSAEYRTEMMRAQAEAEAVAPGLGVAALPPVDGEPHEAEVVDGELLPTPHTFVYGPDGADEMCAVDGCGELADADVHGGRA